MLCKGSAPGQTWERPCWGRGRGRRTRRDTLHRTTQWWRIYCPTSHCPDTNWTPGREKKKNHSLHSITVSPTRGTVSIRNSPVLQFLDSPLCSGQSWTSPDHPWRQANEIIKTMRNQIILLHTVIQSWPPPHLNKQFPTSMTQKLMEANLYLERGAFPLDEQILKELKKKTTHKCAGGWRTLKLYESNRSKQAGSFTRYLVVLLQEGEFFFLCSIGHSQDVAQWHVLKSLRLSDVII